MAEASTRVAIWLLAGALVLPGCTSTPAQESEPLLAEDTLCPGAERFDVTAIHKENAENAGERAARISNLASVTPLPPGAEAAQTRIRVRVPDTAMWPWDTRLTLWKDSGDTWQIAIKIVRYNMPPPPPPPPQPLGEDGLPAGCLNPHPRPSRPTRPPPSLQKMQQSSTDA